MAFSYGEDLLAHRPISKLEDHPFSTPRLFIQYILSYSPYWRPFLYPQYEAAPCRGDRNHISWPLLSLSVRNNFKC